MKERKESRYRNAVLLSRPKKFLARFLDGLSVLILSLVFFAISDGILSALPVYRDVQERIMDVRSELYSIVEESGLSRREDGTLLSSSDMAEEYLKRSVLCTLEEVKAPEEISQRIYKDVEPITPEEDGLFQYYVSFKVEKRDRFEASSMEKSGLDYYQKEIIDDNAYFEYSDGYPYLNSESALAIDEYFVSGTARGKEVYDAVLELFDKAYFDASEDLMESYEPYVLAERTFLDCRDSLLSMRGIALLFSYLLGILMGYLLFPVLFQDGRTLSDKALDIAYTDITGKAIGGWNIMLRIILSLIANLYVPFVIAILLFGGEGVYFMDISILGFFNILVGFFVSFLYLLVSGLFDFVSRKGMHQTVTEILSQIVAKNGKEFMLEDKEHGKEADA